MCQLGWVTPPNPHPDGSLGASTHTCRNWNCWWKLVHTMPKHHAWQVQQQQALCKPVNDIHHSYAASHSPETQGGTCCRRHEKLSERHEKLLLTGPWQPCVHVPLGEHAQAPTGSA